jgi:uridine kinase
MNAAAPVRLVAITGGSGAGKTWLADRLAMLFGGRAGRLSQDSFYRDFSLLPWSARAGVNFDHPDALDWAEFQHVLEAIRHGRACRLPAYDFATHTRSGAGGPIEPRSLMIVDGLWLLHQPEIRRQFDLTLFLHCPEDERLRRRIARDVAERGRTEDSVRDQFEATVSPMHGRFVSPQAAHADLLLHSPCREAEVLQLQERLSRLVRLGAAASAGLMTLFRSPTLPLVRPAAAFP